MSKHRRGPTMSPKLRTVVERAKRDPGARFHSLAHLLEREALRRAFARIRSDATPGLDGVTKEEYARNLEDNLGALHARLRTRRYRHQPIRRVYIPKDPKGTKMRPIGISTIEDKIVQGALTEVLGAVFEQDFLSCSFGFRPGRSAHDALRVLNRMLYSERSCWILELDIEQYFDSLDRAKLRELLQIRIADGALMRLIGKCLHVGVLDGEEFTTPEAGTAQGSIISPLLGNVYLHYALDEWFEDEVRPTLRGRVQLIRYADDAVLVFTRQEDAERALGLVQERMAAFGLTLHATKTRLIRFVRPARGRTTARDTAGLGTFDFLGFTVYWRQTRRGFWVPTFQTRKASRRRFLGNLGRWCRRHQHQPLAAQHAALSGRLQGHYQYFGVNGNIRSLNQVRHLAERIWYKWLRRRSQRSRLNWERFARYLRRFPLPAARMQVRIWATAP